MRDGFRIAAPPPDTHGLSAGSASMSRHFGLFLATAGLVLTAIWIRPEPMVLYGTDAACYAQIAKEMAERPLAAWPSITWYGQAFYEHPPLAFWVESLFFRAFGVSPDSAIALARLYATAVAVLVGWVGLRLAGPLSGIAALFALVTLSGFLYESQNPMLELPLTLCVLLGVAGLTVERRWLGSLLFAVGVASAWFVKGPPALALAPMLVWAHWRWHRNRRFTLLAASSAVLLLGAAIATFEIARAARGEPSFFLTYFNRQVLASSLEGRSRAAPIYYFLPVLWRWYPVACLMLPVALWTARRDPRARPLIELGALWCLVFLVGFSLPAQKHPWYIHPVVAGCAWLMAPGLAHAARALGATGQRHLTWAVGALAAAVILLVWVRPDAMRARRPEIEALHALPEPRFAPNQRRRVADCGELSIWKTKHLMAFLWDAQRVDCDAPAPLRFDGTRLTPTPR